jgi:murein DD-endopeptidase MepM/ murein hydrolase activator NlpD
MKRISVTLAALCLAVLLAGCSSAPRTPAPPAAPAEPGPLSPPGPATKPGAAAKSGPSPSTAPVPPSGPTAGARPSAGGELPATPMMTVTPPQVDQGAVAVLTLEGQVPEPVSVQVEGLWEQPRLYRYRDRWVAFLGFPAAAPPGSYPVQVRWNGGERQGAVVVRQKAFPEDRLVVSPDQEATFYDPRQEDEWRRVFALRSRSLSRPYWTGPFRPPLDGPLEVTTQFGEIRFVNGQETGRHSGMDFGAPTGTPILAPAPGKVILAEKLIVSGWTIIIDHGLSLFTTYYHCDSLAVRPGDWVETGQVIGRVGSTGFSTGPHLHWTATIGNIPVDPWPLTQASPLGVVPEGVDPM